MKTVLITGAARGIGRATALAFAKEGCALVLNTIHSISALEQLQAEIKETFQVPVTISIGDVSQESYVEDLFDDLKKQNIIPDILVNNAGISQIGLLQDLTLEQWHHMMAVNLDSVFLTCRKAIPLFLQKGTGNIINIASVWGLHGASCETAYSASKGGVIALTKALAQELAPSQIPVNAIACGAIDTDMNHNLSQEDRSLLLEELPMKRMGSPEEVAYLVCQLALHQTYITGQVITLDGGWM